MERINLHLTLSQRKFLKILAEKTGLNISEHIRRAIDNYLLDLLGSDRRNNL